MKRDVQIWQWIISMMVINNQSHGCMQWYCYNIHGCHAMLYFLQTGVDRCGQGHKESDHDVVREGLRVPNRRGSNYYVRSFDMEGIFPAQHLNQIMEALYDVQNEVRGFQEEFQERMQDLAYKV